jgi:hypothetical protein
MGLSVGDRYGTRRIERPQGVQPLTRRRRPASPRPASNAALLRESVAPGRCADHVRQPTARSQGPVDHAARVRPLGARRVEHPSGRSARRRATIRNQAQPTRRQPEWKNARSPYGAMVSQEGIEPSTRRLRVTRWMSAGIQRVILLNDLRRGRPPKSTISAEMHPIGFHLGFSICDVNCGFQGTRNQRAFPPPLPDQSFLNVQDSRASDFL